MRPLLIGAVLALCLTAHLSSAAPASVGTDVGEQHQETLETLHLGEPGSDDTTVRDKRTIGPLRQLFPGLSQAEAENQLAGAESQISEVRVELNDKQNVPQEEEEDLKPAASGDNLGEADADAAELENETDGASDDENRNKRFLPFNLGGSAGGSGGSGGGSGNFLFDIIRLIAGSGTTQERDEAENAPLDGSTSSGGVSASASASASVGAEGKDDGYQEGVPGPITRLFVIANRGIANLVQDLILRLAQTSERLVNFKARLITSII